MRGVRFTKAERAILDALLENPTRPACSKSLTQFLSTITSIRTKLLEADEVSSNPSVQPLEQALITAAGHKVVALQGDYARASRQAGSLDNVNVDSMSIVGQWLYNQNWITGKLTILDVLNKWSTWYSKALADHEERNNKVKPGIGVSNAVVGNTGSASKTVTIRRSAQGFR